MWRVLLVIVVLADPDLISSVGSTRGLSLGNTASNSNNYASAVVACILHACLVVGCGGCGMWIEIPAMSPQAMAGRRQPAARQISQKKQNSSVRRQPVRLGLYLFLCSVDKSKITEFVCTSSSEMAGNGRIGMAKDGQDTLFHDDDDDDER